VAVNKWQGTETRWLGELGGPSGGSNNDKSPQRRPARALLTERTR